jgi:hypothetical protein
MADGSTKPIGTIKIGDAVTALNPVTGHSGPRRVTRIWRHNDSVFYLRVERHVIATTRNHPFWNSTEGRFERADQFKLGDGVLTASGEIREVGPQRAVRGVSATVYNLTVADLHTYYVTSGDDSILVHNCGANDLDFFQARDRVSEHVFPLHGSGTESTGSKFNPGATEDDILDLVYEGLQGSTSSLSGNHSHVYDYGRVVGQVQRGDGTWVNTTRATIWINDGQLGTIHPTLAMP